MDKKTKQEIISKFARKEGIRPAQFNRFIDLQD